MIKHQILKRIIERIDDDLDDEPDEIPHNHYGKFAGSYAQDVAGFDDDTINDAFEGESDAFWSVD